MKQTAVEWLYNNLKSHFEHDGDLLEVVQMSFEQAKKMEKKQIIESGNSCAFKQHLHSDRINKMSIDELEQYDLEPSYTFGEEYYNETFNK